MVFTLLLQLFDPHDQQAYRYRTDDCAEGNRFYSHKVNFQATILLTYGFFILRDKDRCALY